MAINRADTPLAPTSDPEIDPTIKRTVTVNPNGTKTYKMSWRDSESKSAPARKGASSSSVGVRKSSGPSLSSKSTYHEREITTLPEVKTKGLMEQKPEIKTLDASKLANRGDDRTWQEKRKQEMLKKSYNTYKQGDETMSEWKERSKKASEEVSRKERAKGNGFLQAKTSGRGGSGGGGCHSC